MISHLYRFRSIKNLLDRNELENHEIFFAHPKKLNDPTEGIKDIFWLGDEIVWSNLFKHCLVCLNTAWALLAMCGEEHPFNWNNIPINYLQGRHLTPEQELIHNELFATFFKPREIKQYIKSLSERRHPIRRNELAAHLRDLHLFAITTIHEYYERHNPSPAQPIPPNIKATLKRALTLQNKSLANIERLITEVPDNEYAAEAFYTGRRLLTDQLNFINLYNDRIDPSKKNKLFVFVDFPETYVDQIEGLVYPPWYAACFMENCTNSSIWGNYGTNHAGVCLRFKVESDKPFPYIRLNRICGFSGGTDLYRDVEHQFYKIDYQRPLVPINFFRSIARVPIPMLRRYWYRDDKGRESACADDMFKNEDAWRTRHWQNFYDSVTRKAADWEYEQEYRLILASDMLDFSSEQSRKLKYDFASLDGIILGINTSLDD
jgi:Protein of unknown function (DUF2971)